MRKQASMQTRIYTYLLVLYPADVRRRFGRAMVEIFEDLIGEAGSAGAVAGIWALAVRELLTVAIPLRLENTRVFAAAVSLLLSSFLAWFFFRSVG